MSIVSPVYMSACIVDELVKQIKEEVSKITDNFEIILVEDGSPDQSWQRIEKNCEDDKRVKGIKLSRNFGQHYAIAAGLAESYGEYVIVMDCDLQDNPKYIPDLLSKSREGFDIVYTVKKRRRHGTFKDFFAWWFHKIFNWLIGNKNLYSSGKIGSYSLITRKVVDAYGQVNDYYRPYLVILHWLGFSTAYISIEHDKRFIGGSSYTPLKLIQHAMSGIISQTDKLLKFSIYTGFTFAIACIISIAYIVIEAFRTGFLPGWASIVALILFSTTFILLNFGVIGIYIGKLFEQVKGRPLYIVDKKVNISDGLEPTQVYGQENYRHL
jgi:dolichol-phosphate mannosyltransferase